MRGGGAADLFPGAVDSGVCKPRHGVGCCSGVHSCSQPELSTQEVVSQLSRAYWAVKGAKLLRMGCAGGRGGSGGSGGCGGLGGGRDGTGGGLGLARQTGEILSEDSQEPLNVLKRRVSAMFPLNKLQPGWCW